MILKHMYAWFYNCRTENVVPITNIFQDDFIVRLPRSKDC